MEQCNLVKQAKATLAELEEATSEGAGTSRKSSKKAKEARAMADASDQCTLRPKKNQRMPRPRQNQL